MKIEPYYQYGMLFERQFHHVAKIDNEENLSLFPLFFQHEEPFSHLIGSRMSRKCSDILK